MAMQMGLFKIVFFLVAGYTTAVLLHGKLSDVLGELQVRQLAMEVRSLASTRAITVLSWGSNGNITNLVVLATAVWALGYGYMLWKVTKGMATAVENVTKQLEHVSDALAATKRYLKQRIENVDGKLNDQIEVSKQIQTEVKISKQIQTEINDVRGHLSQIGFDLDSLQRMVTGLDDKLLSLEEKQEFAQACVMYLCGIFDGQRVKMPEKLQEQLRIAGNSEGLQ